MADAHPSLSFFNDIAKQYDARYSSKDWDNILPMHTEGAYLIPGANPPAKGKEEVKNILVTMTGSKGFSKLNHSYSDYIISGDVACCRGTFTLKDDSGQVKGQGNTMVIYKKENGKWLIHYDMFAMN